MNHRDDIDGSQRPKTADAPSAGGPVAGHLGRGGDPVEGRDPSQPASVATEGPDLGDHLGAGGDPVEGKTDDADQTGGG